MHDIYENIDVYNPNKNSIILIEFDDMVADILSNNKPQPIVTKHFSCFY